MPGHKRLAAGAGTETEAELLSEACLGDSTDHAEPFAFDDTKIGVCLYQVSNVRW
jgi:hypothetical protein